MNSTLLIGSNNPDKARELAELLIGRGWSVRNLAEYGRVEAFDETADTFEANALEKARHYSRQFGLPCVADDSGLEVKALGGRPGVYSARYAGEDCTYADNNRKLLAELKNVPDNEREARFVCCAAFVDLDGRSVVARGEVYGRIASECGGENGFGYDPLFVPTGHDLTFAQMDPREKHELSHRGRAFRELVRLMIERLAGGSAVRQ